MKKLKLKKHTDGRVLINWICLKEKCPQSCCGIFEDRSSCYEPVDNVEHFDILISNREATKYKSRGFDENIYKKGNNYCMKLNNDRSCPFLKNNLCSKYKLRPNVCRAYPFYIDLFSGLNMDTSCPGIGKGWTSIIELKKYLNPLSSVYKEHLKKIIKGE